MITASSALRPLMTNVIPVTDIAGDVVVNNELSINPLSVIFVRIAALNNTGTLANYANYVDLANAINNLTLYYRGQSIISMSGGDIVALNWLRWGILPEEADPDNVDNDQREIVIPLIMGRHCFDPVSCFPQTRRGDLTLRLDLDDADTGYDNLSYGVDTLELIGAKPKEFERRLTLSRTNGATGQNDLDLVPRRVNRGLLLFGTTSFAGAVPAPSFKQVRVLLDNQEVWYSGLDWQVMQSLSSLWGRHRSMLDHKHSLNAAAAGVTETLETSGKKADAHAFSNYAYLDFDTTRDDTFSLDTTAATRFQLRHTAGTADAVRAVQMEVVPVNESDFPSS